MAKPFSKVFVIDASILKTAGESDKNDKKSAKCREFLQGMRRICHRAILTPEIEEEWDKHQSKFASRWRVTMISLRKIVAKPIEPDPFLRNAMIEAAPDRHVAKIMLKDARLIEAARAADLIVVSLDDVAKKHFSDVSGQVVVLKHICWINPNVKSNQFIKWMEAGAKPLDIHKLGR